MNLRSKKSPKSSSAKKRKTRESKQQSPDKSLDLHLSQSFSKLLDSTLNYLNETRAFNDISNTLSHEKSPLASSSQLPSSTQNINNNKHSKFELKKIGQKVTR